MKKEGSKKSSQPKKTRIPRIIELYQSGLSMREVGSQFGITAQRVEQILKKAGVKRRKYTRSKKLLEARKGKRRILPKESLIKYYKDEKLPVGEILQRLKASRSLLYRSLAFHDIPKRETIGVHNSPLTESVLRRLYLKEDLTAAEIARKLGYAVVTVKKRLSKLGIRKSKKPAQRQK